MQQVLIIEDDVDIRELVVFKLRQVGFDVRAECDGEAGLAAATTAPPDLVLLDLMMPKLSGIDVLPEAALEPGHVNHPDRHADREGPGSRRGARVRRGRDRLPRQAVQPP